MEGTARRREKFSNGMANDVLKDRAPAGGMPVGVHISHLLPRAGWQQTWVILILAGCLVMLAGAPLPQLDSVTAYYGKVAKHVLATGEWFILEHPDRPGVIADKPPLAIWLMAISLRVGGDTDVALRLWQLLMSVALVLVTYQIARLAAEREEALLAALLLVTFQQVFYFSNPPQQDVPLTLFLALAFYAYLIYRRDGRTRAAALAGLWVALGVLSKGIVALAMFGPVVGADLLFALARADRTGHWRWAQVAVGASVFLIVAAPWFIIGAIRLGMPFVQTFMFADNGIARFFHPYLGSGPIPAGGFWVKLLAYVPMLMLGMLPWTGLLPGSVGQAWRSLRAGPPSLRLCSLWTGFVFLFLSLSAGDKIIRYLYPCYPPLAVLAARFLAGVLDDARRLRTAAGISVVLGIPVLLAAGWFLARGAPRESQLYLPIILPSLIIFALALIVFALLTVWGNGRQAVAALTAGAILSYGLTYWMVMQRWEQLWPWRTVAATVNQLYRPGDRVLVLGSSGAETDFAAYRIAAPVTQVANDTAFTRAWQEGRVFGLLSPEVHASLRDRLHPTVLVQMPIGWVLVTNQ